MRMSSLKEFQNINDELSSEVLLELDQVSLGFGDLSVFHNFSFQVTKGDCLVLVGPSGSGKTLFLKLLAGLIKPDSGKVLYRGTDLSTLSNKIRREFIEQVGMLFQKNALFDSMTVRENLNFTLTQVRPSMVSSERKDLIEHYLEAVDLGHVESLFPGELSGGMQKRLGIARALVLNPRLVFYDDPTAGLDPISSRKIIQLILDLKDKLGATIVTVTHDMARAYQLAGRILVCFHEDFVLAGSESETRSSTNKKVAQFINGQTQGPLGLL